VPEGSADRPAILVSACLLGVRCNHKGEANTSDAVRALGERYRLIPVCPESMGGLPTPRPAAERRADGRVVTADGTDVTEAFDRGARATVALAHVTGAGEAVLKARSPSCGDEGVTTCALRAAGVTVCSEEDVEAAEAVSPVERVEP
jgi:uncharacterized protein YbbK (DUF523 family)